jgi:hypothetical protein
VSHQGSHPQGCAHRGGVERPAKGTACSGGSAADDPSAARKASRRAKATTPPRGPTPPRPGRPPRPTLTTSRARRTPPTPSRRATAATMTLTTAAARAMAMATSSPRPRHPVRRGRAALGAIAATIAIAAVTISAVAFARPGRPAGPAFPRLRPAAAPAGWRHLTLPNGTAVLSYPPGLRPVAGDKDAVSAARVSPGGAFRLYLNATPGKAASGWRTGPRSGCTCCAPTTPPRHGRSPPRTGSHSAAAPGPVSWTATSRGSAATTSRRSLAWSRATPAPASSWPPPRPPSGPRRSLSWRAR